MIDKSIVVLSTFSDIQTLKTLKRSDPQITTLIKNLIQGELDAEISRVRDECHAEISRVRKGVGHALYMATTNKAHSMMNERAIQDLVSLGSRTEVRTEHKLCVVTF